ncbi:putative Ig domain-containing protein [Reichenbachiella versicolor]|uniref:putative Ig domain-containing protein n=1 Tax=Reichenbachiella versicolor TaxID=1821036 RepID=UPI000D6DCB8E|nr:putative Ig domain-containing protein [Reichenbachiella versicolor]
MKRPIHSIYSKYIKYKSRLDRAIQSGDFYRYTIRKRQMLLDRLNRLKRQLTAAGLAWKIASLSTMTLAGISTSTFAQNKDGSEFLVNTETLNSQGSPSVAMDADGDFVIVWQSDDQDGNGSGVYAQLFDQSGNVKGIEFLVNTETSGSQWVSSVAMDDDGNFVVSWIGPDGSNSGVYARRFNANGVALGDEFLVNTETSDNQYRSAVAMDADGDFVITWQSANQDGDDWGIYAQRYNASGVAQDGEFLVNTKTSQDQRSPSVAMDADGDFVVSWTTGDYSTGFTFQRFDASGVPQGSETSVISSIYLGSSSVGMAPDGDFVITWRNEYKSAEGIYAKRYNADGVLQGDQFLVNTFVSGQQSNPSIAMEADGDFVIVWQSSGQDGSGQGVYGQRFRKSGEFKDEEFQINTETSSNQQFPVVASDDAGGFVVAWQSTDQDGSNNGVYAQKYAAPPATPTAPVLSPIADQSIDQGLKLYLKTEAEDVNEDVVTYSLDEASKQLGMDIDPETGEFTWSNTSNREGSFDVIVTASDGALTHQQEFMIQVNATALNGSEFQVSSRTSQPQQNPTIAIDKDGEFMVVWQNDFFSSSSVRFDIRAQRYNAFGQPKGDNFKVNTYNTNGPNMTNPSIDVSADGSTVVVWQDSRQDGSSSGIFARRYNSEGEASDAQEFRVNTTTSLDQSDPSVGMDTDGNFVIAWQSRNQDGSDDGIYAQRYDASGTTQGTEFLVNSETSGKQSNPSIAVAADGSFVIVWQSFVGAEDIYAQRYDASGVVQGTEFRVNGFLTGRQVNPSISVDSDGNFVVTWQSEGQDGDGMGVYAQRYDFNGVALGTEFRVNTETSNDQSNPSVSMEADGSFVIVWDTFDQDGSLLGIYGQKYNDSGVAQESEFRVNVEPIGNQSRPTVSMRTSNDFVVAWQNDVEIEDESHFGVLARRFLDPMAPIFEPIEGLGVSEGLTLLYQVIAKDINLDLLTFSLNQEAKALGMEIDPSSGLLTWKTKLGQTGRYDGVVQVSDGKFTIDQPFTVVVEKSLRIGGEFQVNTTTELTEEKPFVSMSPNGSFVVVWSKQGGARNVDGIYAQIYNSLGNKQGPELIVQLLKDQDAQYLDSPVVAIDADGNFIVVWKSHIDIGDVDNIMAQQYNASGELQGDAMTISSSGTNSLSNPFIDMNAGGDFVILWQDRGKDGNREGVYARRYNSSAIAQGDEFLVNTNKTDDNQANASIAMNDDGEFVISWYDDPGDGADVYVQRYDAKGVAKGLPIYVNDGSDEIFLTGEYTSAGIDQDGNFVVVWDRGDYNKGDILAQRYNSEGAAIGNLIKVVEGIDFMKKPQVRMNATGEFVITWSNIDANTDQEDIFGRLYNKSGEAETFIFQVNTETTDDQKHPSVDIHDSGDFVITWQSKNQDGFDQGIYAQRFSESKAPVLQTISNQTITEESTLLFTIKATDEDSDVLTFSLDSESTALGMTVNASTGEFKWTPNNTQSGSYNVKVTVDDGRLSDSQVFKIVVSDNMPTGLSNDVKGSMKLFPNPVRSELTISLEEEGFTQYEMIDLTNKIVKSGSIKGRTQIISTIELPLGVYVLKVSGEERIKSKRFIKID